MMICFKKALRRFRRDEKGATLVEYGIAITLAVFVGTVLLQTLATEINTEIGSAAAVMQATP